MVMHRSTIVIVLDKGRSWQACKIEKEAHIPKELNYTHYWAPIHVHTTQNVCDKGNFNIDQAELHELTLYPDKEQSLEEKCMVDLERSYDIGNEDHYLFVYVGRLDSASHDYAKRKHRELYVA